MIPKWQYSALVNFEAVLPFQKIFEYYFQWDILCTNTYCFPWKEANHVFLCSDLEIGISISFLVIGSYIKHIIDCL